MINCQACKVVIMLIEPEEWRREWGEENLIFASEHCHVLPNLALAFLISHGLPRRIIFEDPLEDIREDDEECDREVFTPSEISFEFLSEPLGCYNWEEDDDEELVKAW